MFFESGHPLIRFIRLFWFENEIKILFEICGVLEKWKQVCLDQQIFSAEIFVYLPYN